MNDEAKFAEYVKMLESVPKGSRANIARMLLKNARGPEHTTGRRTLVLALAVIFVLGTLAGLVLFFFKDQPDIVLQILVPAMTFIAGAGGGYSFGKSKRNN